MAVEFEQQERIAVITLNRPDARNAVNGAVAQKLEDAIDQVEEAEDIWLSILTANGKVFCAGADLKEIAAGNGRALWTNRGGFAGIVKRERNKPMIAAITGSALAGGTEIALSCDMIVCSEETNFGLPEVKRSLVAGAGGLFRLPRAIGMAPALEAILTGDPLPAHRAYELGMVNKVVPTDRVMHEASRRVAVQAFTAEDDALWQASNDEFRQIAKTEDYKEGPKAFIEKRTPNWRGR